MVGYGWKDFNLYWLPNKLGGYAEEEREANANFIVQCCNNHERLVEALKSIADYEWVNKIDDVKQLQKWINEFVYVAKQALQSAERLD